MSNGQKLLKKIVSVILALVFIISSVPSYAADFKDVPSGHWAKPYIDKMSKVGIIAGYEGNLFKPSADVSRLESLVFVSRLINADNNEKMNAKLKYNAVLNELKVPDWAKDSVAICLSRGVISPTELINLHKLGLNNPAKKIDITEYLVKAMGLEDLANEKTLIALPFVDAMSIDKSKDKYVAVLVDLKIVRGDDKNRFNPNSNVKRDVMATMLSNSYDEMMKKPTIPEESLEIKEGIVKQILAIGDQPFLTIDEGFGESVAYRVNKQTTSIYVDGKKATIDDIAEGQRVKIKVEKGDRLAISIDVDSIEEEYTGKIKYLYPINYKLTLEYEKDKKTYTKTFDVDINADIYLDEEVSYLSKLKEGDTAKLIVKNNKVYEIDSRSKSKVIEGVLKYIDKEGTTYYLTVVDSKDKSHEYPVHKDAYITRNKAKVSVEDLRLKDEIYMEVEYDKIVDIDAKVVEREIKGFITLVSTYLYKNTEISVRNLETKEEETFILGRDPYIRVDNKVTNSYDIKPGYYVEIVVEGDEITEIYADSRSVEASITGKIKSINYRRQSMIITSTNIYYDGDYFGEEITVYLGDDAVIVDSRFNELYFDDLLRDDIVNIKGSYDGSTFIANRIILE